MTKTKKILSIVLGLSLLAGLGFTFSQTELFKGSFKSSGEIFNQGKDSSKTSTSTTKPAVTNDFSFTSLVEEKTLEEQKEEIPKLIEDNEDVFDDLNLLISSESRYLEYIQDNIADGEYDRAEEQLISAQESLKEQKLMLQKISTNENSLKNHRMLLNKRIENDWPILIQQVYENIDNHNDATQLSFNQKTVDLLALKYELIQVEEEIERLYGLLREPQGLLNLTLQHQFIAPIEFDNFKTRRTQINNNDDIDKDEETLRLANLISNETTILRMYLSAPDPGYKSKSGRHIIGEALETIIHEKYPNLINTILPDKVDLYEVQINTIQSTMNPHLLRKTVLINEISDLEDELADLSTQMKENAEDGGATGAALAFIEMVEAAIQDGIELQSSIADYFETSETTEIDNEVSINLDLLEELQNYITTAREAAAELEAVANAETSDESTENESGTKNSDEKQSDSKDETSQDEDETPEDPETPDPIDLIASELNHYENYNTVEFIMCATEITEIVDATVEWTLKGDKKFESVSFPISDCPGQIDILDLDEFGVEPGESFEVTANITSINTESDTSNNTITKTFTRKAEEKNDDDSGNDNGGSTGGKNDSGSNNNSGNNYDDYDDYEDQEDDAISSPSTDSYNHPYSDVEGHWSEEYVAEAYANGWLSAADKFYPNRRVNVAEFIKMLAETSEIGEQSGSSQFNIDIPSWVKGYLVALEESDVIRSRDGLITNFASPITRCDAALYIARTYGVTKYLQPGENPFPDVSDDLYCAYAIVALSELQVPTDNGYEAVIKGFDNGDFKPFQYLTRAEALTLLIKARGL